MARHHLERTRRAGFWVGTVLLGCAGSDQARYAATDSEDTGSIYGLSGESAAVEGSPSTPGSAYAGDASGAPGAPAAPSGADIAAAPAPPGLPLPPDGNGDGQLQAGTLTAGTWDDNRNLERFLDYRDQLASQQMEGLPPSDDAAHRDAAARAALAAEHTTLDVALVIDTTGSMGDELVYLQTEFDAIAAAIDAQYPSSEQRWALIVYRDDGDEYATRSFDFGEGVAGFRERLEAQSAGGGGDYPEASHAALAAMNQLSWRSDAGTARLAFWVADAPHHAERAAELADAVDVAAAQDVHLYPVASSGVNELTEYTMRAAAQLTLGRYLFLTDDSGVGGEHKEPSIPCYFVTRLDDAILRMVDIEMSGVYHEPDPAEVIRAGGAPADGACRLASGQTVFVF